MSIPKTRFIAACLTLFVLFLSTCNMPSVSEPTNEDLGMIHTIAAQTVEAQLTLDAGESQAPTPEFTQDDPGNLQTPSITPSQIGMPTPSETLPPPPTNTPRLSPTNTPIPCDQISFVDDVTIPDGTEMVPGQKFTKTWRLKNSGSCTWTSGYSIVFFSGDSLGAPAATQLTTGTVVPGQEFDVSIELESPIAPGTYRGNFKLRNTTGTIFGVGSNSTPFYVEIKVEDVSGVMVDFIASADDASWGYGTGAFTYTLPGEFALTYGTIVGGTDAYVMIKRDVVLEGGSKSGTILETHPENNGYIIGRYPVYLVGSGDYIKARLGFLAQGDGTCGAGDVKFYIHYTIGDDLKTLKSLGEWKETCDGVFRKITVDLSSLVSKTVRFYLIVSSNGASTDDMAIWDSIGVFR